MENILEKNYNPKINANRCSPKSTDGTGGLSTALESGGQVPSPQNPPGFRRPQIHLPSLSLSRRGRWAVWRGMATLWLQRIQACNTEGTGSQATDQAPGAWGLYQEALNTEGVHLP